MPEEIVPDLSQLKSDQKETPLPQPDIQRGLNTVREDGSSLDTMASRLRKQREISLATAAQHGEGALLPPSESSMISWDEERTLEMVLQALPTFHGRSLTEVVAEFPTPIVWDLGSGDMAVALSELIAQNPNARGTGVTLPLERENLTPPKNVTIVRDDVDHFLTHFDRS